QNKDPDTFIREKGNEALANLLKSGIPLSTMILETICSSGRLSSVEGKSSAIAELKNLFKSMSGGIFKRQLMQAAGQHLSCSISEFWHGFKRMGLLATTRLVVANLAMNSGKTIGCLKT
ncbi:MAG: hypothetical protein VXA09_02790, partial [Burkholderiaceae bacterium]